MLGTRPNRAPAVRNIGREAAGISSIVAGMGNLGIGEIPSAAELGSFHLTAEAAKIGTHPSE
jgi:hypothetical protein